MGSKQTAQTGHAGARAGRFDVAVLGAGAAGMMCAAVAGQGGASVVLIDHATKLAEDRKSTRLNSSHIQKSRMPSSA